MELTLCFPVRVATPSFQVIHDIFSVVIHFTTLFLGKRQLRTLALTWRPNFGFASFLEALYSTEALPVTFGLSS